MYIEHLCFPFTGTDKCSFFVSETLRKNHIDWRFGCRKNISWHPEIIMGLDYFYGQEADQFTFYRIPKVLFTDERFRPLSAEAKLLYGLLLDRMALSQRNGWFDDQNRVYIIFTIEDGKAALGCAEQKIIKLLNELEKKGNLIER